MRTKIIYKQSDPRWGKLPFPGGGYTVGGSGCSCLAITHVLMETAKYHRYDPRDVRPVMTKYATYGSGLMHSGISATLNHFGIDHVFVSESDPMSKAWKALEKPGYTAGVLLFYSRKGPDGTEWTGSGHFISFTAYKVVDGKHYFYLKDSGWRNHNGWYCYERSMKGDLPKLWICKVSEPKPDKKISIHVKKSTDQVINDAVRWGVMISKNNAFHYGHGKEAHHNGCYFCGTQPKSKKNAGIKDYEHTSCCNPFVHACFAHGGQVPEMLRICQKGSSYGFSKGEGYDTSPLFKKVSKPQKSALRKGYVLCSDTHVMLYIGDGKIVHAGHEDDNKPGSDSWNTSIRVQELTDYLYKTVKRVYKYIGTVDADIPIRKGEYSDRVEFIQKIIGVEADGIFLDKTEKALKKWQRNHGLEADGIAGKATLKEMQG